MIMAIILMINFIYRYIYICTMGGHNCEARNSYFSGQQNQCRVMSVVARILLEKVWLSEVPCQHTTSSHHVRVCLVGLKTTSNTARGVFGPFPADYFTMAAFLRFCFWRMSHPRVPGCSWSPCSPQGASQIGFLPRSWLVFR